MVDRLIGWAGTAGIISGIALAAAYLMHPPSAPPATVASALWIWVHIGFMISLLCGVFLLIALFDRYMRAGGGMLGAAGFVAAVVSLIFVFGLDYAEVFIFPTMAVEYPEVVERYGDGTMMPSIAFTFPATGVLYVIGFVLFGLELYKTEAVDKGAALLTIIGTIIFGVGLSGYVPMFVVRFGSVVFGAALIWLGVCLLKEARHA